MYRRGRAGCHLTGPYYSCLFTCGRISCSVFRKEGEKEGERKRAIEMLHGSNSIIEERRHIRTLCRLRDTQRPLISATERAAAI